MQRPIPTRPTRHGFTLMELLLVLALLTVLTGIAWPLISRAYVNIKLRNAAEQIQAAWGKARVQAISTGLPHVFRFEMQAGDYSVVPWQDENADLEAAMPISAKSFDVAIPSATTTYSGAATTTGPKLPENMIFSKLDRGSDSRTMAADAQLSSAGITATSPPVVFYPDGTSSDAVLTITNRTGRYITVNVRGLTGVTRVGEITTGPEVNP